MSKDKGSRTVEQNKGQDGKCAVVYVRVAKSEDNPTGLVRYDAHAELPEGAKTVDAKTAEKELAEHAPEEKPKAVPDVDFASKTVVQLRVHLTNKGIEFGDAKKDELVALCVANP